MTKRFGSEVGVGGDPDELAQRASSWMLEAIAEAIQRTGRCHLALSGGKTPRATLSLLSRHRRQLESTEIYFVDERCVPKDHPESNYRMVDEVLLIPAKIPASQVHRMEAERTDLEAAAREYERGLPSRFDVLVLGIGEDGHTASLFPGSPHLAERRRRVAIANSPSGPKLRMTLTPIDLTSADQVMMLVQGEKKAEAVFRALATDEPIVNVPAKLAKGRVWLLDRAAASRLPVA